MKRNGNSQRFRLWLTYSIDSKQKFLKFLDTFYLDLGYKRVIISGLNCSRLFQYVLGNPFGRLVSHMLVVDVTNIYHVVGVWNLTMTNEKLFCTAPTQFCFISQFCFTVFEAWKWNKIEAAVFLIFRVQNNQI